MTASTDTDIANLALQAIGTRTTIASLAEQSNEAIQCNLIYSNLRDEVLRMAPWNCATNYISLDLISAVAGTPENTNAALPLWQRSLPPPPWTYEYLYPDDCLRALWMVSQVQTASVDGIPLSPAVTGGAANWIGPPVKFREAIDHPVMVLTAAIVAGGTGYVVNDYLDFAGGSYQVPVKLQVRAVDGTGAITSIRFIWVGSYAFGTVASLVPVPAVGGTGSGATFTFTVSDGVTDYKVLLTNQENAILAYVKQVTQVAIWDSQLRQAMIAAMAGRLVWALTGMAQQANSKLSEANMFIQNARATDANEGLTVNDVTPDWIRARGIAYSTDYGWSPNQGFDWGPLLSMY